MIITVDLCNKVVTKSVISDLVSFDQFCDSFQVQLLSLDGNTLINLTILIKIYLGFTGFETFLELS